MVVCVIMDTWDIHAIHRLFTIKMFYPLDKA